MGKKSISTFLFAILAVLFASAAIMIVLFCRDSKPVLIRMPQSASSQVEMLMEAVCQGDYDAAQMLLYEQPDLGAQQQPKTLIGQLFWDAYVQSLDYELEGQPYATDTGLVQDVRIISMELETVTERLGERARNLLGKAVEEAEDVSELYDEKNEYREALVMDILQQAVHQALEEDVRYRYEVIPLQLVYAQDRWQVAADQTFFDAVSGGVARGGEIIDQFDMYIDNVISDALEGILATEKVYWLQDEDMVAPVPDPANYGQTDDPEDLEPILEQAQKLLAGQEMIFKTDVSLTEGSTITYYLDETILCITWQHSDGNAIYTCSEVKIAHPSQFRRFLSDGEFGSGKLYKATEMAASVNAVTASNGDYYAYRGYGNLVYNGQVKMSGNRYLDTCYVDENGDLIMVDWGELYKKEDLVRFVQDNQIRFSLAFGPILIEDGKVVAKHHYALGETDEYYSRAALCQLDSLHYMFVTLNRRGKDVSEFAFHLKQMGVQQAYALDGGQTSTIVTGNVLMNPVDYGGERETSDIIYFATAVPDGG